jgi:prepilin-type N-terminal cleavage/methylation domain-containing protein
MADTVPDADELARTFGSIVARVRFVVLVAVAVAPGTVVLVSLLSCAHRPALASAPLRPGRRRRRCFTMLELIVVVVVMGSVALIAAAASAGARNVARDAPARSLLAMVVGAQQLRFDTYGAYAETPSALDSLLANTEATLHVGPNSSQGPADVVMAIDTSGDYAVLGAAVVGASGECFTWRSEEAASGVNDDKRVYAVSSDATCNGELALTPTGGSLW